MESLKEVLKIRSNLLKYLRKAAREKRRYNLMDMMILPSIKKSPGITGKDFNKDMDIDSSYITRDITKLKDQKLIDKKKVGRQNIISLTRSGNLVAERMIRESEDFMDELCQKMGREEVEGAMKVIKEANRMIEERLER